jgi:hypothetical protein
MTRYRFWKTWAALAVAVALGAYIYRYEWNREDKPDKVKEKVFTLEKAKAQEVTLTPAGSEPVRLVKEGDSWRLAAPLQAAADGNEVESLLSSLETLEIDEVVAESPPDLGQFGLASPKTSVAVRVQGAPQPLTLLLGDKTPDGGGLYAKQPEKPRVFTVPGYLESSFTKKPFDLRDRDLLHVKRDGVRTLEVSGPQGGYALARDDKGEWSFTRPLKTRAGRWSVDGLLGTLESLRFESIASEQATPAELKKYGLDKPSRTVALGLEGKDKTLEIGASAGEKKFYAREAGQPLVAVIPGALVDDLAKGPGELRAKRLFDVATYEVQGMEILAGTARKVLARSSVKDKEGIDIYKWKRTVPDGKDLDTNTVQDALFLVGGVEAQEFVDAPASLEAYGLSSPALKVTLTYDDAAKPAVWFELGRKEGAVYARRADDTSVMKLDPAKGEELLKKFGEL